MTRFLWYLRGLVVALRVQRMSARVGYNAIAWNEQVDSRIIGGSASQLIPAERGRSRTRGMRP